MSTVGHEPPENTRSTNEKPERRRGGSKRLAVAIGAILLLPVVIVVGAFVAAILPFAWNADSSKVLIIQNRSQSPIESVQVLFSPRTEFSARSIPAGAEVELDLKSFPGYYADVSWSSMGETYRAAAVGELYDYPVRFGSTRHLVMISDGGACELFTE